MVQLRRGDRRHRAARTTSTAPPRRPSRSLAKFAQVRPRPAARACGPGPAGAGASPTTPRRAATDVISRARRSSTPRGPPGASPLTDREPLRVLQRALRPAARRRLGAGVQLHHAARTTTPPAPRPGRRTPRAMIAENDLALGEIVDLISHSPIWEKSLILVIEDDSQDGADHVDAHRIPAFAISPYAKRGAVVHTRYDFLSFIRTLELVVGMKPLNLFDAHRGADVRRLRRRPADNSEPYDAIAPERRPARAQHRGVAERAPLRAAAARLHRPHAAARSSTGSSGSPCTARTPSRRRRARTPPGSTRRAGAARAPPPTRRRSRKPAPAGDSAKKTNK